MASDFHRSEIDPGREALREGVGHFNRGDFFEAHEVLEAPWRRMAGAERDVYQGLIKAAAALHHASRGKWRSAILLLRRALLQLRPRAHLWPELPLGRFLTGIEGCLADLERCDEGRGTFDPARIPRIPSAGVQER